MIIPDEDIWQFTQNMHLRCNSKICFTYIKKSQKAIDFISCLLLNDPSLQKEYDQINWLCLFHTISASSLGFGIN